ncbi:MAG: peptidase U62 [Acidobacteria bacterium]|nr:peptidase U62 [Acidobacteriota bacterium]
MPTRSLILASLAISVSIFAETAPAPVKTAAAVEKDPVLIAMKAELERSKEKLVLPGMQRPYFIEYRLEDIAQFEASANFGALVREDRTKQKAVRVTVRIGDYKNDSSTVRGDGIVQIAPEDAEPAALRQVLWFATDEAYKNALRTYAAKQADLKRFQAPPTADDFSPAKPVIHIEPLVKLTMDEADWTKRIVEASGIYASDERVNSFAPDIQFSSATVHGLAINRYTVNTEGTELRQGYTIYTAGVSLASQAPDGMRLSRDNGTTATVPTEMESGKAFHERVVRDLLSLRDLRNAPLVSDEDYHGPVLFSGDSSADIFNRLFVPNVEADKPAPGTTARTQGAYTSSYHSRVLPEFLSVVDDPLMKTFAGKHLAGSYEVDDEGVPAQAVEVVSKGVLEHYLINRAPVKDVPQSNGHGRAALAQRTQSRSGVMLVKPVKPVPAAQLHRRLVAMAKDQKRDFVYEAETLAGELLPRLLYRVYRDGHRELVRGAVFDELDQRSMRSDIVAAGDDPYISMTVAPIPQTTIVPSLLFGQIGVKRASPEQEKLPYYAPPQ